jgi:hypothetical protein
MSLANWLSTVTQPNFNYRYRCRLRNNVAHENRYASLFLLN